MQLLKSFFFKKLTLLFIGVLTFCSVSAFGQNHKSDATQTIKGEVVDMSCYMGHGAKGEEHKACAKTCLEKGLPAGLLTQDGQLYLLVENHSRDKAYAKIAKYAAEDVAITGTVANKNGMKAVIVKEVKKL